MTVPNGFYDRRSGERMPPLEVLDNSLLDRFHDGVARALLLGKRALQGFLDDHHLRLSSDQVEIASCRLPIS